MADDQVDGTVDASGAPNLDQFAQALAGAFSQISDFTILKTVPLQLVAQAVGLVISIPIKLLAELAVLVADALVAAMRGSGAQLTLLEGAVLSEIFDTPLQGARGAGGGATGQAIGSLVIQQLLDAGDTNRSALGAITPSSKPAEQFLGKLLGVGVRGWGLDLLADLGSLHHVTAFNDLVETVVSSLGIGRLARTAMGPAIHSAVAQPLQWLILSELRPTLLGTGPAVKQYLRGQWDFGTLENELGPQGYSADRIEALVNDGELRLSATDVSTLVRNGVWDDGAAVQYLRDSGYSAETAASILQLDTLRQLDALRPRAIAAYEAQFKRGQMSGSGFVTALGLMDVGPELANAWLTILQIEQDSGFKVLDLSQLNAALATNVISSSEWRDGLKLLGYSDGDATILELTAQGAASTKEAAAQAKANATAKAAADKAAAAVQKQADAAAAAAAKVAAKQAADQQKAADTAAKTATLVQKQALLAAQAQQRRDQVAAAQAAKTITDAQAAQALADIQAQEQAAAAAVATNNQIQATLSKAADATAAAALNTQAAADAATRDAQAATDAANNQQAQLTERRQERLAQLAADLATVDQEEAAGILTATAATKKRDALNNANTAAVAAEKLDQLAIARAQRAAQATTAKAAAAAAKTAAQAALIPDATARAAATTAAAAAATQAARANATTATAAAKVTIAQQQAAATQAAATALDTLLAQQTADLAAWELAHPGA